MSSANLNKFTQFTCVWDKDSKINYENSQQMEVPHSNLTLNF